MTTEVINIADYVLEKVNNFEIKELKNFISINKYLPHNAPKYYGFKYYSNIHKFVIQKNKPHSACIIYTPTLGLVKDIVTNKDMYRVLWQEREEKNYEKGYGRHNLTLDHYSENLICLKNIERFLGEQEFIEYCENYFNSK